MILFNGDVFQNFWIDRTAPSGTFCITTSNDYSPEYARLNDYLTIVITPSEPLLETPTVTCIGLSFSNILESDGLYSASTKVVTATRAGAVTCSVTARDLAGNAGTIPAADLEICPSVIIGESMNIHSSPMVDFLLKQSSSGFSSEFVLFC